MKSPTSQSAKITVMKPSAKSPVMKWGIVLFFAFLHIAFVIVFKSEYSGALSLLPAGLAGWFFGSGIGVLIAILSFSTYAFILNASGFNWVFILDTDFVLGALILTLIGGVSGWLSTYYRNQTERDDELKSQLNEADALSQISIALSQAERVGLSNILQLIVDSAKKLIPAAEQAVIHILDDEKEYLIAKAVSGFQEASERRLQMRLGEGIAGQAITRAKTINITDINTDERFIKSVSNSKFRSLLVTPIVSGEQKLGAISIQSQNPNAFTKHEQDLLYALGVQAAIAIENAHLLESTQQSLRETNALYRINQGLVALNANELLDDVVSLLQKNFGYYHVQVYIIEPATKELIIQAASGEIGQKLLEQKAKLQAGQGIAGYAAETLLPFFTNNVEEVMFFVHHPLLPDTKSEMAIPVKIGERLFGILDIQQAPPKTFTARDLQLVSVIADQLAIALQKADLYETLQNALQQEKAMRNQLIQNERLAAIGRLLASVSHELNNPLQAIQNALFLLKEEQGISEQGKQDLNIVLGESERMANMIKRLRDTYRPIRIEDFRQTQLNALIEDVYALVASHLRHNQITFEFFPDPELQPIPALTDQIRQAILNLVINAVEAMTAGGKLTIYTEYLPETEEALITISDNGKGIATNILSNIFEAFTTDKDKGTGLGLTITYDIITKHHGRITAENNPGLGATFRIWLPTKELDLA
ncbi:MAG: GAF domain-containing protein [Anaerolineales bacterium]|nr:GAF domain-containing protein [Anaerolineales bacterium]